VRMNAGKTNYTMVKSIGKEQRDAQMQQHLKETGNNEILGYCY